MTETAAYKPAKLVPVTSAIELRERTVRDYATNARRAGINVPAAALERLAVADLETVDLYQKGVDRTPVLPKAPKKKMPEIDPSLGMKKVPAGRSRPLTPADLTRISARWPFAMGRMRRILEGCVPVRGDIIATAMSCAYPEMALRALRLHADYSMRGRESKHNPFNGLSEVDCTRALVRFTEDVCDASSSRMGPWWVPK